MKILTFRSAARFAAVTLFAGFALAAGSSAQDMGSYTPPPPSLRTQDTPAGQSTQKPAAPAPPAVDLKEQADYKALYDTPDTDPDAKIIKQYDASMPLVNSMANRVSYVIAPDGTVIYEYTSLSPDQHVANTLQALRDWTAKHKTQ